MTTSCSYDIRSLFSLRSQAILLLHYAAAEELNIWQSTAQRNARGQTQPFPFANYINGIGTVTTKYFNVIPADMSWTAPAEVSGDVVELQSKPSSVAEDKNLSTSAQVVAPDEPSNESTGITAAATSSTASDVRKSSLADLTNGDRVAINAHLAQGLGPHKLLSRFASQKSNAKHTHTGFVRSDHAALNDASKPDSIASVVDDSISKSAVIIETETFRTALSPQTAPDVPASNLMTGTTPTESIADSAESLTQSPHPSPRLVRSAGPHDRLEVLGQVVPLPQSSATATKSSTSDEGPATSSASTTGVEPAVTQDSPPETPVTEDGDVTDVMSIAHEAFKANLSNSLSDKDKNSILNPEAMEYLPPSRSVSSVSMDNNAVIDSESICINDCCPIPGDWCVPNIVGTFAKGRVFEGPMLGDIPEKVLVYYSNFFATAFRSDSDEKKKELDRVVKDPSFALFHLWVHGRDLVKHIDGADLYHKDIDLKTLVQLWRFAAHIQAPVFANVIADAIMAKTITANDIFDAGDEIDTILKVLSVNHTFRLIICHAVILSGVQLDQDNGESWPQSLLWSILACLDMGRYTYYTIQEDSKIDPCIYHLHPSGSHCNIAGRSLGMK
jgi:hypothetical protein